jgi:hypothetical protein
MEGPVRYGLQVHFKPLEGLDLGHLSVLNLQREWNFFFFKENSTQFPQHISLLIMFSHSLFYEHRKGSLSPLDFFPVETAFLS